MPVVGDARGEDVDFVLEDGDLMKLELQGELEVGEWQSLRLFEEVVRREERG